MSSRGKVLITRYTKVLGPSLMGSVFTLSYITDTYTVVKVA